MFVCPACKQADACTVTRVVGGEDDNSLVNAL